MTRKNWIGVDWGITNLRAYLMDTNGQICDQRVSSKGMMHCGNTPFADVLDDLVSDWSGDGRPPVLMCGMIGSRQGWHETAYVPCPVDHNGLRDAIEPVPGADGCFMVPGISCRDDRGHWDVMRSEETQIFGLLSLLDAPAGNRVVCLPGTHTKWVSLSGSGLRHFETAMTGEIFSVLCGSSILGTLMTDRKPSDPQQPFLRGVELAGEGRGFLFDAFKVRADGLFDHVPADHLKDYLSGLLIGTEIGSVRDIIGNIKEIDLIGPPAMVSRYVWGCEHMGYATRVHSAENATVKGLSILAEGLGF